MAIKYNPYNWEIIPLEKSSKTIKEERNELISELNENKDNFGHLIVEMYAKRILEKNTEYINKWLEEHEEEDDLPILQIKPKHLYTGSNIQLLADGKLLLFFGEENGDGFKEISMYFASW